MKQEGRFYDMENENNVQSVGATYHTQESYEQNKMYDESDMNQDTKTVESSDSKPKKKSKGRLKKVFAFFFLAVAFGLIAGAVMFGVNTLGNKITG